MSDTQTGGGAAEKDPKAKVAAEKDPKAKGKKVKKAERVKLGDAKGARLTIHKVGPRSDGSFVVKAVHVAKEGASAKTGMADSHPNDTAATKRVSDLVELAKKAGWQVIARKGKAPKVIVNEFTAIPSAAR